MKIFTAFMILVVVLLFTLIAIKTPKYLPMSLGIFFASAIINAVAFTLMRKLILKR